MLLGMEARAGVRVRVAAALLLVQRGWVGAALLTLGLAGLGPSPARAQAVLVVDRLVSADVIARAGAENVSDLQNQPGLGSFEVTASANATNANSTASGSGNGTSALTVDPESGEMRGATGSFDASVSVSCSGPPNTTLSVRASAGTLLRFELSVPTEFTFVASGTFPNADTRGAGSFVRLKPGGGIDVIAVFNASSGGIIGGPSADESGTLQPGGTYVLHVLARADAGRPAPCPSDASASSQASFSLTLTPLEAPPSGEAIRWINPAGGSFEEPSNWEPPVVPGPEDTAVFDLPTAGYAVTSVAPRPRRLLVRNGQVEHRTGVREVVSLTASPDEPSIAVGDGGTLQVTGGALTSLHTVIGDQGAATATLDVLNVNTFWIELGRLTIGGAAPGRWFLVGGFLSTRETRIGDAAPGEASIRGPDSQLNSSAMLIGNGAPGSLIVEEGATVEQGFEESPATIGLSAIGEGTVRIVGAVDAPSTWNLGENSLTVGEAGRGELTIESGGVVSSALVVVGAEEGAEGLVVVDGTNAVNKSVLFVEGALLVGGVDTVAEPGGSGVVEVANGALLIAPNLPGAEVVQPIPTVVIGASGPGRVTVRGTTGGGDSSFLDARLLRVGAFRADGRLDVVDGGDVRAETARVGAFREDGEGAGSVLIGGGGGGRQSFVGVTDGLTIVHGKVTLVGGRLFVGRTISIGFRGALEGFGTVSAPDVYIGGRIAPGLREALSPQGGGGGAAGGRGGAGEDTLVVEGDVTMEPGGVIEIPASAGGAVALQVSGALALDGALEVAIARGTLPRAGDVLGRIEAGSLSGSFRELRVRGVAGLTFRFDPATGALIALTDALPCGAPDRDGDGVADCAGAVAGFEGLGVLDGDLASAAAAISGDGAAVVGASSGAGGERPFRWTRAGGLLALDDPACAGDSCVRLDFAAALSGDGAVVAGGGILSPGGAVVAARWSEAGGAEALRDAEIEIAGDAAAISADATRIAGTRPGGAFLVTPSGVDPLGDFTALALSADGAVAVGTRGAPPADTRCADAGLGAEPVRRAAAGGVASLGNLRAAGGCGAALATSGAGAVVVGASLADDGVQAFRWTAAGGLVALGDLPGGAVHSVATGVSADGAIVVGYATTATGTEAFVWDASHGMRRLADVLTGLGVDLGGWTLRTAAGVSADGTAIVGAGPSPAHPAGEAWRALLVPEPDAAALAAAALAALAGLRRSSPG